MNAPIKLIFILLIAGFASIFTCAAQNQNTKADPIIIAEVQHRFNLDPQTAVQSRVTGTSAGIITMFHEAGMSPKEHPLTEADKLIIAKAFAALPPLHQQVLKQHLQSISFLDDMPNTALTSTLNPDESFKLFHITFRAAILRQKVTEWLSEKENTCFSIGDSAYQVKIEGGQMNALTYVLLHESTHVVDGSLEIFSATQTNKSLSPNSFANNFIKGVWAARATFDVQITDSVLNNNHFRRGGRIYPVGMAEEVYRSLQKAPLVSLYSTSSWSEDLAEFLTVYHLTQRLKQPFKITVYKNDKLIFVYEPMKSPLLKSRAQLMDYFYAKLPQG